MKTYNAIKPEALPRAKSDFIAALDEGETTLLRSASDTDKHYVRIAEALNSNKVLLRSAWHWLRQRGVAWAVA